ncbi:hypothetical protein CMO83_05040 [Candidatus Woesearchaeota archaeon]|jgi:glycosyltransferase involved in cell wall biosynthesis|nr:hypothetical protein [Candidatus Woesearchaeota archaeon]|tara:strand:- start:33 stop:953 length:921 start_codon:yes stop_codon:yes gene_type:complete
MPSIDTRVEASGGRPLVSIVMPDHNAGDYVSEAVENIAMQTFLQRGNLELIVVDDGSNPGELDILKELQTQYGWVFEQFIVHSTPQGGKNKAIEAGKPYINKERSKFTFVADADDNIYPLFVDNLFNHMTIKNSQNPNVVMVYSDNLLIDKEGRIFAKGVAREFTRETYFDPNPKKNTNYIPGNALVLTDVFLAGIPIDLKTSNRDKKLRHVAELGDNGEASHLPNPLFFYRQHPDQMSGHWNQLSRDNQFGKGGISDAWPKDISRYHWREWLQLPIEKQLQILSRMPIVWNELYWQNYRNNPKSK